MENNSVYSIKIREKMNRQEIIDVVVAYVDERMAKSNKVQSVCKQHLPLVLDELLSFVYVRPISTNHIRRPPLDWVMATGELCEVDVRVCPAEDKIEIAVTEHFGDLDVHPLITFVEAWRTPDFRAKLAASRNLAPLFGLLVLMDHSEQVKIHVEEDVRTTISVSLNVGFSPRSWKDCRAFRATKAFKNGKMTGIAAMADFMNKW
jgi:hypothetical protein